MVKLTNFLPRAAFLALASLSTLTGINADLQITSPSSSTWWVAKSQNVLQWTCHDTNITQFTVLISNTDPKIAVAPLAIIGVQNNFDCSLIITQDQANQPAGTGWLVLLANILNQTDVYATSQPFEIKPLGSLYPSQATPSANASSGASSTAGTASAKPTSAASAVGGKALWGVVLGAVAGGVAAML